jgi:hypothetical protein
MQWLEGSNRDHIPSLAHPMCLVAALSDSPVVCSRRILYLYNNKIDSLPGVTWPASLTYVSPPPCSG